MPDALTDQINQADNARWLMEAEDKRDTDQVISIPGNFLATYREGTIIKWTFIPLGSDAGYRGPAAQPWYGSDDEGLDLEDSEGKFWVACQHALGPGRIEVQWEE